MAAVDAGKEMTTGTRRSVNGLCDRSGQANCERFSTPGVGGRVVIILAAVICLMIAAANPAAFGQQTTEGATIQGSVSNSDRSAASDASVRLEQATTRREIETRTAGNGAFTFAGLEPGSYLLTAERSGSRSRPTSVTIPSDSNASRIDLVLQDTEKTKSASSQSEKSSSAQAMEFADKPNFTVAGVTDWTAAGGHGSDSILRTSEDLARQTLTLKDKETGLHASTPAHIGSSSSKSEAELRSALAQSPEALEANRQLGEFYLEQRRFAESIPLFETANRVATDRQIKYDLAVAYQGAGQYARAKDTVQPLLASSPDAKVHRIAGEINEKLGDPLFAVREYEQAARMDPSEQNYFEWGSELLLHRAVWQAQEVFERGAKAYPRSARMLTALGSALFAGALYDRAAQRLCDASDLDTANDEPYLFMGKIALAAPKPLACIEPRLARFVKQEPDNSVAYYLYAMAIWKRQAHPADPEAVRQVETLLQKAVQLDPHCADGYLQLGVLSWSQRDLEKAIDDYKKAIEANPQLGEAHYRLGVAYDRRGDSAGAAAEFKKHDEIEKTQADAIEQQRREVKQFLVVLAADTKKQSIQ